MARRIICVSRTLAAGGEEAGRLVAQKLGFRYVDREIVVRAAERARVSRETVERAERPEGLVARILRALASSADVGGGYAVRSTPTSLGYERLIEGTICEAAENGDVVIVAHGGSIALAGMDGLLRVLVTASPGARASRLAGQTDLSEGAAEKAIHESDRKRIEYLSGFYNVQQELPTHYDLVVNTDTITPAEAAQLVVGAAEA
jgi:cytidylate kinase